MKVYLTSPYKYAANISNCCLVMVTKTFADWINHSACVYMYIQESIHYDFKNTTHHIVDK